jgi:hypothetical protein
MGLVVMDHYMDHYREEGEVKIGDHVRRRGLLAEMFGDEEGTVVNVIHGVEMDEFEVKFGTRLMVYSAQQIILS